MATDTSVDNTTTQQAAGQNPGGPPPTPLLNAKQLPDTLGSDYSVPQQLVYRGQTYTFNGPSQYERFRLDQIAQQQRDEYAARKARMGIVDKDPTITATGGYVNNIGGQLVPAGSQLVGPGLENFRTGKPFSAVNNGLQNKSSYDLTNLSTGVVNQRNAVFAQLPSGVYGPAQNPVIVQAGKSSTAAKVQAVSQNNQTYSDPDYFARVLRGENLERQRQANTGQANYEDKNGNTYKVTNPIIQDGSSNSSSGVGGSYDSLVRAGVLPNLQVLSGNQKGKSFFSTDISSRPQDIALLEARGGVKKFLVDTTGLTGYPLADINYFFSSSKQKILANPAYQNIAVELSKTASFLKNVGEQNAATIDVYVPQKEYPINNFVFKTVTGAPPAFIGSAIQDVTENPERIPELYYGGKAIEAVGEGVQFVASSGASAAADSGIILRTSTAGLSKGLQLVPYVAGTVFVGGEAVKVAAQPNYISGIEELGKITPGAIALATGSVSARGIGQNAIKEGLFIIGATKEIPANTIAEQSVIDYYAKGPETPGAQKFSVITAGDLAQNKAAFEQATFLRPTYTQKIFNIPVGNAVDLPNVPLNPDIIQTVRTRTGQVKNYDVITATQAQFKSDTTVLRGTSKQGGLYVAPTGQAQLYFLGLGPESDYATGLVGFSTPNLVRVSNIKAYSEELIPLFQKEGPGSATLSDEFLRTQARPKTVYLEKRTYLGETPEVQAVIPEGTPLRQRGLSTPLQRFFGYKEFIRVGNDVVPVRQFSALKNPGVATTSVGGVRGIVENSESYAKYKGTIDPLRAAGSGLVLRRSSGSVRSSGSLRSSFAQSLGSSELSSSRGLSSSNSFLSRSSLGKSNSVTSSGSSLRGSSNNLSSSLRRGFSRSNTSVSGSSQSLLSSGSSFGSGASFSSGLTKNNVIPGGLPFRVNDVVRRKKKAAVSPSRVFLFTPTFVGADLGKETSVPFKDVFRTNLAIRPVLRLKGVGLRG